MSAERVEARGRRAPFLWASSAAFRILVERVPAQERRTIGWVYSCLAATASDAYDGGHQGFVATREEVMGAAGVSLSTFKRAVERLEELGLLVREERTDDRGGTLPSRYVLLEPGQGGPPVSPPGSVDGAADDPPNARTRDGGKKEETGLTAGDARRPKPISYRGKRVPPGIVVSAEQLLDIFNEATGRKLGHRALDGNASPYLRQIIGALIARPEIEREAWERAIRNTAANPPGWTDGRQLQTGDVFGERAADHALANSGVPAAANGRRRGASVDDLQALKGTLG